MPGAAFPAGPSRPIRVTHGKSSHRLANSAASLYSEPSDVPRSGWADRATRKGPSVLILPAIDLRGGQCVRLRQGDYAQETVFGDDPAAMARRWVSQGAAYLHLVDLDGARHGQPMNGASVRAIVQTAGVPCQVGGGLRKENHIAEALDWGVARVVLGTRALQDPEWCEAVCRKFPGKVALGIDARDGRVATEGWLHTSDHPALDLAKRCSTWPLAAII